MTDFAIPTLGQIIGKSEKQIGYERLLEIYAGPNGDLYTQLESDLYENKSRASWNWLGFFLPFTWLLYRKMWWWAALVFFGSKLIVLISIFLVLALEFDEAVLQINAVLAFVIACFFGASGHYVYLRHAKKRIWRIVRSRLPGPEARKRLERQGGVSYLGGVFGLIVFMLHVYDFSPAVMYVLERIG